jgi:precorrin-4 methylase
MNPDMNAVRLLGAAQLVVFFASVISEQLLKSVVGTGSMSDTLVNISENVSQMRISNLVALIISLAIVSLGVLF